MSSPLDIARDEWPALRWREGRHPIAGLVGTGAIDGFRVKVIVWRDNGDAIAYGDAVRLRSLSTCLDGSARAVGDLPLRSALRELRRRLA